MVSPVPALAPTRPSAPRHPLSPHHPPRSPCLLSACHPREFLSQHPVAPRLASSPSETLSPPQPALPPSKSLPSCPQRPSPPQPPSSPPESLSSCPQCPCRPLSPHHLHQSPCFISLAPRHPLNPHHHPQESLSPLLTSSVPITSLRGPSLCPQSPCHPPAPRITEFPPPVLAPVSPTQPPAPPSPSSAPHHLLKSLCLLSASITSLPNTPITPSAPCYLLQPHPLSSSVPFFSPLSPPQCQRLHCTSALTQHLSPTSASGLSNTISVFHPHLCLHFLPQPPSSSPSGLIHPPPSVFSILILTQVPCQFSKHCPPGLCLSS